MNRGYIHAYVAENTPNICQIVVRKNGEEIYADEWNGYRRDDCVHVMSVTKSVMALLVGIAIDNGQICSIDDKVLSYFPEYSVKRGEKTAQDVTIRHLLTMKAPYKCKGDPWTKVCSSEDWTKASLDLLGGRKGITGEFNYQTVCLHILSGILYRATGMKTVDYANSKLFAPLGIREHQNYYAMTAEEHKAFTISKTPKDNVWFSDPEGIGTPGYGLCMSASDMVKIGQLCLDHGLADGKRIVSSDWIREITAPTYTADAKFRHMKYGSLWWILDETKPVYAAIGNSGNVIYVDEKENLTVAVASYFMPTVFDRIDFIENTLNKLL